MVDDAQARTGITLQGRYQLHELIGQGAMGQVYRAERLGLGRSVAVKFLRPELARDPSFVKRFEHEARVLGRLQHPHCVSVLDFGQHGQPYFVMDFVAGESLRALLMSEGTLAPRRAVGIARQLLGALAHAHENGIVHRDAKPENILLERGTALSADHVRVLDFGLSRLLDETSQVTEVMMVGTPSYMAPEQFQPGPIDARADVYACGVVLYEMLTGTNPFTADSFSDMAIAQRYLTAPPPRPGQPISPALLAVIGRALSKAPATRFASAAEMKQALEATPEHDPALAVVRRPVRDKLVALAAGSRALAVRLRPSVLAAAALVARHTRPVIARFIASARRRAHALGVRTPPLLLPPFLREPRRRLGAFALAAFVSAFGVVFAIAVARRAPAASPPKLPAPVAIERA